MAIAYRSHTSGDTTETNSVGVTLDKPTGLASGDLMTLLLELMDPFNAPTVSSVPFGFTQLTERAQNDGANRRMEVYQKIADSDDVAASTFAVERNNADGRMSVMLTAWTGAGEASVYSAGGDTGTAVQASTLTPAADSMLVFHHSLSYDAAPSSHAIATSDPGGWTVNALTGNGVGCCYAYALRSQSTATGDWTATLTTSQTWRAIAIAIPAGAAPAATPDLFLDGVWG